MTTPELSLRARALGILRDQGVVIDQLARNVVDANAPLYDGPQALAAYAKFALAIFRGEAPYPADTPKAKPAPKKRGPKPRLRPEHAPQPEPPPPTFRERIAQTLAESRVPMDHQVHAELDAAHEGDALAIALAISRRAWSRWNKQRRAQEAQERRALKAKARKAARRHSPVA